MSLKKSDEIKRGLECCGQYMGGAPDVICNVCPYQYSCTDLYKDALAYIQQLEDHIGDITKKVEQLEAQVPKWISVHAGLPGMQKNVVFITTSGLMMVGKFSHIGKTGAIWFRSGRGKSNVTYRATHWMPLPEAPEEDVQ